MNILLMLQNQLNPAFFHIILKLFRSRFYYVKYNVIIIYEKIFKTLYVYYIKRVQAYHICN